MAKDFQPSRYPGGFNDGVVLREVPIAQFQPGRVYWVYNGSVLPKGHVSGSDGNDGSFTRPFATLDFAIGQCTANRGDVILVKAGHAENVESADGVDLDVAGVTIIGLGEGALRPTFTFDDGSGAANVAIGAANTTVKGLRFLQSSGGTGTSLVVEGVDNVTIQYCEFAQGNEGYSYAIDVEEESDNLSILDNTFTQDAEGEGTNNQGAIILEGEEAGGGPTYLKILRNHFSGDFEVAPIFSTDTEVAVTDLLIADNYFQTDTGSIDVIGLDDASETVTHTGMIVGNRINGPTSPTITGFEQTGSAGKVDNIWAYGQRQELNAASVGGAKKVSVADIIVVDDAGEGSEVGTVSSAGPILVHSITGVVIVAQAAGAGFDNVVTNNAGNLYATDQGIELEAAAIAVGDILNCAPTAASLVETGTAGGVEDGGDLGWYLPASTTIDMEGEAETATGNLLVVVTYTSLGGDLEVEGEHT